MKRIVAIALLAFCGAVCAQSAKASSKMCSFVSGDLGAEGDRCLIDITKKRLTIINLASNYYWGGQFTNPHQGTVRVDNTHYLQYTSDGPKICSTAYVDEGLLENKTVGQLRFKCGSSRERQSIFECKDSD